ncbi:MAG: cytochrome c3 family protein [Planctomycetota bacterium]
MFTRRFERRIYVATTVVLSSLVMGTAFGTYALWPANLERGYQPEQPIEFSHAIMAGKFKIECIYCHSEAEKGPHAGIPDVETCMKCHAVIQPKDARGELKPEIVKLLDYWERREPIQWEKVYDLADFVYFDHRRHLAPGTGLECADCHGPVETMDRVERVYSLKMAWCLDCHMEPPPAGAPPEQLTRASIHCSTCHR